MKKIIALATILGSIFMSSATAQQLPNGGFETWTNTTYGEVPQGAAGMPWTTNDSLVETLGGHSPNKAVKKVTDSHTGTYALCIQESYIEIPANGYKDSGGGVIFLGYASFTTFQPFGVPYTARPVFISGYYKLTATIPGADTSEISAIFKLGGTIIGQAKLSFYDPSPGYQAFLIPVNWSSGQQPDKLEFFMDNGGPDIICRDTSTRFYVDDLQFNFPNGIKEELFGNDDMQIYPNPANDKITISLLPAYAKSGYHLSIHDAQGRLLQQSDAKLSQTIALTAWPQGTYFIQLRDPSGNVLHGSRVSVRH